MRISKEIYRDVGPEFYLKHNHTYTHTRTHIPFWLRTIALKALLTSVIVEF